MNQPLTDAQIDELSGHIFRGEKIAAIKVYREMTGTSLKEAKEAVEDLEKTLRAQSPESFSGAGKTGCAALVLFALCGLAALGLLSKWS